MRWQILTLITGLVAISLVSLYPTLISQEGPETSEIERPCFFLEEAKVTGSSMLPLIEPGSQITIAWDYYDCNPLQKGDIIVVDFAVREHPMIKRLVAVPGDKVEIINSILYVNDIAIKNSANKTYTLTEKETEKINNYIQDIKEGKDFYLVLSDNINNRYDSRLFGPVFRNQIKGKVVKKQKN